MSDLIVIGGGISGLSAAYFAAKAGREVLVLERAAALGGCIHSERLAGGFWHELGAHTCYNSYGGLLEILEERGVLSQLLPRAKVPYRLLVDGELRSVMKELKLGELLFSAPKILVAKKAGTTVRGYYGALVGARNYERVFSPLFAAVPSQRADDFPADMLFKTRPKRKDVLRSYTLEGGLSSIVGALAGAPRVSVRTGAEVERIAQDGSSFSVSLTGGEVLTAKNVVVAVPPSAAAKLLGAALPQAAEQLGRLKVTAVKTVGVVVRREATPVERFAGIIPLDDRFFSCVSRDTVADPSYRGFAFHLRPAVSRDDALALAASTLKVDSSKLEHVTEREVVLPSPVLGHAEVVAALDAALASSALGVTGNYFAGLSIEDCVERSKREVGRLVRRA